MNYLSTTSFTSERVPGLAYKLRKMSHGRRTEFRINTAPILSEIELARAPLQGLLDARSATSLDATSQDNDVEKSSLEDQVQTLQTSIWNELIVAKLYPALIRWGVAEVSGIEVDGEPVNLDNLFTLPEEVITEVGSKIYDLVNLTFEQQMLFSLPITSKEQADGPIQSTAALTAA